MGLCDGIIGANIDAGCIGSKVGVERNGVIINWDDIDWDSSNVEANNGTAEIVLKASKKGFKITQPVKTPFSGTKTTFAEGTYDNYFEHEVSFIILGTGQVTGEIVSSLANGKFIVILETADKTNTGFQVYGIESGLTMASGSREVWNTDAKGGWPVVLKESLAQVPYMQFGSFDTYALALTAFNKLLVAGV